MIRLLAPLVAFGLIAHASGDRRPLMEALVRYSRALSAADAAGYAAATEPGASLGLPGLSLWPPHAVQGQYFGKERWSGARINVTMVPHTFRKVSEDTMLLDGRFAHIGRRSHRMLGKPGQFLAVMRRGAGEWKVAAMRMAGGPEFDTGRGLDPAFVATHDVPVPRPPAGPDGWIQLFDGRSSKGWHAAGGGPFPPNWKVENGLLKAMPDDAPVPASIVTSALFTEFELEFDWKLFRDSNSGVKYRILLEVPLEGGWYDIGNEYQLLDDTGSVAKTLPPDGLTGALYDVLAPEKEASRPLGEWNHSRLVVHRGHITHWLNGEKVVEYEVDQDFASPLLLQNHGTECWFRNIRLRPF
ncbi:MAG: DUF1080 domain-containing protein [Bryobacterales bacterium]|nr:DUF1080 domain-containing protein [Bryobacterales bacterium]